MESQTRQYWRTRLAAMLSGGWNEMNEKDFTEHVESWLDDFMQTPELSLAEAAEAPNLRLAVVELRQSRTCLACHGKAKNPDGTECRCCLGSGVTSGEPWVVKME